MSALALIDSWIEELETAVGNKNNNKKKVIKEKTDTKTNNTNNTANTATSSELNINCLDLRVGFITRYKNIYTNTLILNLIQTLYIINYNYYNYKF